MQRKRTHVVAIALPVAGYVGLLLLVAILVRPPLVGWLGLAVVAVVGAALTVGGSFLFPRMRTNLAATAERRDGVLVVADATCSSPRLCTAVRAHLGDRRLPVHVLAPVLASPVHYLSGDEQDDREAAQSRLDATLAALRAAGIAAAGSVGADDPLQAVGDTLAEFPAAELLLVTAAASHWLEGDLLAGARQLVPTVEHVVVDEALVPA